MNFLIPVIHVLTFLSNEGVLVTQVPGLMLQVLSSEYDWNYTTVPQSTMNQRVLQYPRGYILGGCSSHSTWSLLLGLQP